MAYHVPSAGRIMGNVGLSPKAPQRAHADKAGPGGTRGWQRRARRKISRLEGQGFATVMIDEAVCMHDRAAGRKCRFPRGGRIVAGYNGNRRKAAAYGAPAAAAAGTSTPARGPARTRSCCAPRGRAITSGMCMS